MPGSSKEAAAAGAVGAAKDFADKLKSTRCSAEKVIRETRRYDGPDTISSGPRNPKMFKDEQKERCDRHEKKMGSDNGGCIIS